jgi:meiotic recombination protein SPO11
MVRNMQDQLKLPVLGIVDYNVYGLGILLTYKLGSVKMGLESFRFGMFEIILIIKYNK